MFTYKFVGLTHEDAETPYYYGTLPKEAERGQVLYYAETGNRYEIVRVLGKGLESDDDRTSQKELAEADIIHGAAVPTISLRRLEPRPKLKRKVVRPSVTATGEIEPTGSTYEELKDASRKNRKIRKKGGR